MKLSIVVTHYKEPFEVCKPLFDSIALQQGMSFENVEVIVVQDGHEGGELLSSACPLNYPFVATVHTKEHGGVSAARNFGLENATGDYVMFCDCDDCFINLYGLHLMFSAIQENPDAITSVFVEEQKDEDGNYKLFRHENDATFIHGKAYKRQFLVDQKLRFNEKLTIHEDGFFNCLALTCADTTKNITTPFYMWKWNENSTVRQGRDLYVLKTYDHLIRCRAALARELNERGYINEYFDCVIKTFVDSYYDFNKPEYIDPKNQKLVRDAERSFKAFFTLYKKDFDEASTTRKAEIAYVSRAKAYTQGMAMESFTIKEWLRHIAYEVK